MTHAPETLHRTASTTAAAETDKAASPAAIALMEAVVAALRTVRDPEIPVNIYDLGLVYRTAVKGLDFVEIDMTLTAPGCPVAGEIVADVKKVVREIGGVKDVTVNLVFDPPWDRSMMSEEAKLELGFIDIP